MTTPSGFSWFSPQLEVADDRFLVHGDYYWVHLLYRTAVRRPYIAVLCGPSGRNVLDDSPPDHVHHHGVWWGHGDVSGVDFYLELPNEEGPPRRGTIDHQRWDDIVDDAPRFGFVETLAWNDDEGAILIEERRSLLVHFADDDHYTVDLDSTYTARRDLDFGDTKESVLPGIRLAEPLTLLGGGRLSNSEGGEGEDETMGKPARWIDCSGTRSIAYVGGDVTEGIAVLSHPGNPQSPAVFFCRGYGPQSPFPGHHFYEERHLDGGEALRLRHRLVVHRGHAAEAMIEGRYQDYVAATEGE